MNITIRTIQSSDASAWNAYVLNRSNADLYHLSEWQNIIEKTYGHKTYYLSALREPEDGSQLTAHSSKQIIQNSKFKIQNSMSRVVGILPLVHLKHFLFGNSLVSIPFFDMGGILADNEEIEQSLLNEAIKLGQKLKVKTIELRHTQPLSCINADDFQHNIQNSKPRTKSWVSQTRSHKVRMLLDLPDSSERLMKSFKSKLRSQIKKPLKEGLVSRTGGMELLDDFYKIFSINMRDLGSPVHSKQIIQNVLKEFSGKAKIVMVYKNSEPLACGVIVGFNETLENPWASSLRQYSRLSPNMLLYWTMLEYACDNGYRFFDFGRSSPDEGTYKFKKQWGADPTPLHWHYIYLNGEPAGGEASDKSRFDKAIRYWQKLPVSVTKIIGPMIRKHICL